MSIKNIQLVVFTFIVCSIILIMPDSCLSESISVSRQNALTNTVSKVSPAIVGINVIEIKRVRVGRVSDRWDPYSFLGRRRSVYQNRKIHGLGSGFIISPDGYILTNHHVAGEATEIVVTTTDGNTHNAKIIGSDMVTDIALLKIDTDESLPFLEFADISDLMVGEWAIAFGNPFGLFDNNAKPTVTVGVVSNYGVNFVHEEPGEIRVYRDMIQTDAAISSGNSGGPLLNAEGKVIGMNTTIYSTSTNQRGAGSIGIGFAIPSHRISKIINMLRNRETIDRDFYTGMQVTELDMRIKDYLSLDKNTRGVVVNKIYKDTPAYYAGLRTGDIISSIDGTPILKGDDFNVIIYDGIVGDEFPMTVIRGGKTINLKLRLTK